MRLFSHPRFLTVYSAALTIIVTAAMLTGFTTQHQGPKFDTITVQRINVVEPDGTLRMVLTNNKHVPGIIMHGREYPDFTGRKGSTSAGILFYDAQGSESGGLTFGGRKDAQGNISRFGHLSFDRYDQDQMFTIDARDDGTNHSSAIRMIDQPNWPIQELLDLLEAIQHLPQAEQQARIAEFFQTHPQGAVRTVMQNQTRPGEPQNSENALRMNDPAGQLRMRVGLDDDGDSSQDFLDSSGNVIYRIPPGM